MNDDAGDDLFGEADEFEGYEQDGPDLFGVEPSEVLEPHDQGTLVPVDVDVEQDEMAEIPIDPDDEPETQLTAADVQEPDADPTDEELTDAVDAASEPDEAKRVADEAALVTEEVSSDPAVPDASDPVLPDAPAPDASAPGAPAQVAALVGAAAASATSSHTPATAPAASTPAQPRAEAPLALYRRYRPDTFADVIGQDHVTEPLRRALINNKVNHAYLFSGPRGCGKTTSARILARCLNCELGPTPEPCGQCQSCRDLARGGTGSIDVIEIDAASHGGVNEARDLRERAFFAPVHSRYKIYIIDEAHMVTKEGFNALLKLVEEPPPHVKFIFATTEPEKVLGTIRSRTHHYPFRLVPPKTLSAYLEQLCDAEGVAVDKAVLPLVVRAGAGSVRDSLSVLDQLLGGAGETGVSYAQATALLGYTPDTLLDEIMDAFAAGDSEGVFACIDKIIEVGQDPRRFAEDLLRRLRDLIIVAAVPDALTSGLVDVAGDQAERLTVQAQGMGAGELTRAAEVIAKGLTEMRGTTAPRLYLELMCSRVLLPGADVDERGIHARLDRLERRLHMVGGDVPQPQAPQPGAAPRPTEQPPASAGWRDRIAQHDGRPEPADRQPPRAQEAAHQRPQPGPEAGAPDGPGAPSGLDADRTPSRATPPDGPAAPAPGQGSGAVPGRPATPQQAPAPAAPEPAERPAERAPRPEAPSRPQDPGFTNDALTSDPQATGAPAPDAAAQASVPGPTAGGAAGGLAVADVRRAWPQVLDAVKSRRRVTWIVLSQNAQVASLENGVLTLELSSAGARESFGRGGSPDILRESLIEVLGIAPTIEAVVGGAPQAPAPGRRPDAAPSAPAARPAPEPRGDPRSSASPAGGETSSTAGPTPDAPGRVTSGAPGPQDARAGGAGAIPAAPDGDSSSSASSTPPAGPGPGPAPGDRAGRAPQARSGASDDEMPHWAREEPMPEPPPDEDDEGAGRYALQARENIRKARSEGVAMEAEAVQSRDDADLDVDAADADELIKSELGGELLYDEGQQS